jgi:hypothetical protein
MLRSERILETYDEKDYEDLTFGESKIIHNVENPGIKLLFRGEVPQKVLDVREKILMSEYGQTLFSTIFGLIAILSPAYYLKFLTYHEDNNATLALSFLDYVSITLFTAFAVSENVLLYFTISSPYVFEETYNQILMWDDDVYDGEGNLIPVNQRIFLMKKDLYSILSIRNLLKTKLGINLVSLFMMIMFVSIYSADPKHGTSYLYLQMTASSSICYSCAYLIKKHDDNIHRFVLKSKKFFRVLVIGPRDVEKNFQFYITLLLSATGVLLSFLGVKNVL